ncbi:MAG TPA: Ig-like domain repeat protein [Terracidiphilus sp.]|nr:Ig-like domain repeat protein [Terracidiphilus sp.]
MLLLSAIFTALPSMALANTVSLNVSPASAKLGSLFTLTASVQDQNGNPITAGRVTFYDGASDLGTVQVVSSASASATIGTATLKTILASLGAHRLEAVYSLGAQSIPSPIEAATVNGQYSSAIKIAASRSSGNYTLTGTVTGLGAAVPNGSVTFTDNATGLVPGMVALGSATLLQGFVDAPKISGFTNPVVDVLADMNGDGIPDLLMGDANRITLAMGKGDGTFQPQTLLLSGAASTNGIAVDDFNGDGKLDLAVLSGGSLGVLLGNGDGTFGPPTFFDSGNLLQLAVGDFNGDGIQDIATINTSGTLDLLLGNGDGTFKTPLHYSVSSPLSLAAGDVNGDGISDIAVGTAPNDVKIYLGNADGTLHAGHAYVTQYEPGNMILADFRGIGKLDLAMVFNQCCESDNTNLNLMLGNGDGTFQPAKTILSGANYSGLAAGDLNGEGKLDLLVSDYGYPQANVLLGNGDGTFQSATTYPTGVGPATPSIADLNHDGRLDFIVPSFDDSTDDVFLNRLTETASATLSDVVVSGMGTHPVTASYTGDANYLPSTSSAVQLAASLVTPTMRLGVLPSATVVSGQAISVTVSLTGPVSFVPTPRGRVHFAVDGGTAQSATLSGGTVIISLGQLSVGAHSIAVTYAGDANYAATTAAIGISTVTSASASATTIALTSSPNSSIFGQAVTFTATVTNSTAAPAGSVTFVDGTTVIGTATLIPGGGLSSTATLTTSSLAVGTHPITVTYVAASTGAPHADTFAWTDWTRDTPGNTTPGTASGTLASALFGTINVTYSGQTSGIATQPSWGPASTFSGGIVGNAPPAYNGLALEGGYPYTETITFSQPVTNPAFAIWSLGSPSILAYFNFTAAEPFNLLGGGPSNEYGGQSIVVAGTAIYGSEGNGIVQFIGTYSSLTFTTPDYEDYYALTVGEDQTLTDNRLTSSILNQVVTSAAVFGTMTFSPAATEPYGTNQPITINDTLSYSGPQPTGAVAYTLNGVRYMATCTTAGSPETCTAAVPAATIAALPVAVYTVPGSFAGDANYAPATASSGTFTITKAQPRFGTMTFSPAATEPYGTSQIVTISDTLSYVGPQPTGAVTYVLNGVTYPATCSGTMSPGICTAAVPAATVDLLPVSVYPVTGSFGGDSNYEGATATSGTFTITQATQTITFNPATPVTYGVAPIALSATGGASGNPVTFTFISGPGSLSGASKSTLTVTGAGNILVEACQEGSANYMAATCVTRTIAVNPAILTVTANSATMTYGGPIPNPLTYSIGGYVNGDGSSVVSGTATLSTTATITSQSGTTYPITFATQALTATNYTFVYVPGTLTVNKAQVIIGLTASPTSIPAGSPVTLTATVLSTTTGTPTGTVTFFSGSTVLGTAPLVNGVATYNPTLLTLGTYTFNAGSSGDTDFLPATSNAVSITVLPATTMTTVTASPDPAPFGTSVTFSATVSSLGGIPAGSISFYDGTALLATAALASGTARYSTNSLSVGSHSITAVYGGATAFAASTSSPVVEQIVDFSISASPGSRTVYTGESATFNVTVTPNSGFSLPIALSCSELPADTTCSFSPSSVTGVAGTSTLVVETNAPAPPAAASVSSSGYGVTALAGLLLLFIPRRLRRRGKGWPWLLVMLAVVIAGSASTGCSGRTTLTGGTPIGSQKILLIGTATNGSQTLTHQSTVTLNVKSLF